MPENDTKSTQPSEIPRTVDFIVMVSLQKDFLEGLPLEYRRRAVRDAFAFKVDEILKGMKD